jgi:hypothetical protein
MEIKARDLNHNINNNKSNKYIKSNRYIKSLSDKIDEASLNYLSQLLNNCYNYNKQLFNFKKNHYKKITGTNWILAYNNHIGYPVLFYNDNTVDYNKFIKWLFKNPIFIDWLTTIFGYIYNNDIKNIYKLIFFTSDKIEEFLNHYTQYNDNRLKHKGFRI